MSRHLLIDAGLNVARAFYYDCDSSDQSPPVEAVLYRLPEQRDAQPADFFVLLRYRLPAGGDLAAGEHRCRTLFRPFAAQHRGVDCSLLAPNGTQTLAVWSTSQTCAEGSCTSPSIATKARYKQSFTLSNAASTPLSADQGAKPILLSRVASLHD